MSDHELANLIRRYCDDELDAREAAQFEERLSRDERLRRQVAFERLLRDRIGSALSQTRAPQSLEVRVRDALAASGAAAVPARETPARSPEPMSAAGPPGRARIEDRRRRFAAPQRANVLAVAATLALIAGAVLFSILFPQIDELGRSRVKDVLFDTAAWLSAEHMRCAAAPERLEGRLDWVAPDDARRGLAMHLGRPTDVADLAPLEYAFLGAGPCMVPAADISAHILYRQSDGTEMVSVFIVPLERLDPAFVVPEQASGDWADLPVETGGEPVRCFESGGLLYFVVCGDADRERVESAVRASALDGSSEVR